MGLDMYLMMRKHLWSHDSKNDEIIKTIQNAFQVNQKFTPSSIEFEVAYWRKANAIHSWFVENVQDGADDCENYAVEFSDLEKLRELVTEVIDKKDDKFAAEVLPTMEGFFFGNTMIDASYWQDVQYTKQQLEYLSKWYMMQKLKGDDQIWRFYYHASW